jgi:hypothetical protein
VKRRLTILDFALFNVGWFAAILGAANGLPWLGPIVIALLTLGRLWLLKFASGALVLYALAFVIGYAADLAVVMAGALDFPPVARWPAPLDHPVPLWMPAMWINFAGALHFSLSLLRKRYALAAAVGLVGGPLAYYAGERLGAVELVGPLWRSLLAVGLEYLIALPLLLWIADRFWPLAPEAPRNGQ